MNYFKSKSLVSEKGQVTIPKVLREALGIRMGTVLRFRIQDGALIAQKELSEDPIIKWQGKGKCSKFNSTSLYLKKLRGAYRS